MKKIKLTQGKYALVDDDDFEELNKYKWCYIGCGYAVRSVGKRLHQKTVYMHRVIMNTPKGYETDHINHDRLDNRKCNLKVCTPCENQRNQPKPNKHGFPCLRLVGKKWEAKTRGKRLGMFENKEDAIKAIKEYDIICPPKPITKPRINSVQ